MASWKAKVVYFDHSEIKFASLKSKIATMMFECVADLQKVKRNYKNHLQITIFQSDNRQHNNTCTKELLT